MTTIYGDGFVADRFPKEGDLAGGADSMVRNSDLERSSTEPRMLADVLWEAANERLSDGAGRKGREWWSCNAALRAEIGEDRWKTLEEYNPLRSLPGQRFLESLGANPRASTYPEAWKDFNGYALQGVRYMWLLLAMHVAEDEGIAL